jgi:hypothetical protein
MNWYAKINAVENGFVVDYFDGEMEKKVVYQNLNTLGGNLSSTETDKTHIVDMFYEILEHFGEIGTKHDKKRLQISYKEQK